MNIYDVSGMIFPLLYIFFFNDTATTEIYTLSLHDALPISRRATWSTPAPPSPVSSRRSPREHPPGSRRPRRPRPGTRGVPPAAAGDQRRARPGDGHQRRVDPDPGRQIGRAHV